MSQETDSVTTKVRALRERAELSMDAFALAMGYSRASSIQRYEDPALYKKEFLAPELVLKMIKALVGKGEPPITAAEVWLLARPEVIASRGGIIESYDPDAHESHEDDAYTREHWRPKIEGAIPEIDVKLGAGHGSIGEVINLPVGGGHISGHRVVSEWVIPNGYLRGEAKASPDHTIICEIVGDSMISTYMPGDRVIVDLSQNKLVDDTVYAISDGNSEPQIKRLQRVPFSDPVLVKIISDNPHLETFTAELSRVQIIGRICGHIARK
ncbi:S24 family peptidase [Rhizobium sp. Root1220]|uniref:S24 family peptidase n=1 Tax=Rhizobium sp. Root1220 TaxID=1736432 RepID=UPI0006FFDC29|nr:S24 family peptidase [Rhizobium sp. Root1220]KQV83272.1 phage repressor protein [Rhizobium sp. Root1220]